MLKVVREESVARKLRVPETLMWKWGPCSSTPVTSVWAREDDCTGGDQSDRVTAFVATIRSRLEDGKCDLSIGSRLSPALRSSLGLEIEEHQIASINPPPMVIPLLPTHDPHGCGG